MELLRVSELINPRPLVEDEPAPPTGSAIILEDGSYLLVEDGSRILLEEVDG